MKKVLFVMQSLYNGGAEKSLVNLLNELPKDKYEIDLLLFKREGMFLNQVPQNVSLADTPDALKRLYSSIGKAGKYMPVKLFGTVLTRLNRKEAHVQEAERWNRFYSPVIPKLAKRYDVAIAYISGEVLFYVDEKVDAEKKIVWIHNDYGTAHHPKEYDYPHLKNMDGIISISDHCVDILRKEFPEFQDKIHMIENITSSFFTRRRADEFYPSEYQKDMPIILSIGRLTEQKGFDMAIDAAKILKERGIHFQWYVIGNGDLEVTLKKQIAENNVGDCFVLLGTKENPYPYIKNCAVFAQTSRYEGKSVVLDEAKIIGVPIVVTDYPTVKDQIKGGKEGIIVPMTPRGIAEGIGRMLTDTSLYKSIQVYLCEHEYGNQDEVQKYIDLIDGKK